MTRSDFIGIRASGGPLWDTSLALTPGLTVLYGLNGAGKTRILEALTLALLGKTEMGVRDADDDRVSVELFLRNSHLAKDVPFDPPLDDPTYMWDFPGRPYTKAERPLINEVFLDAKESDLLCMVPRQTPGTPQWAVWPAVEAVKGTAAERLRLHGSALVELFIAQVAGDDERGLRLCQDWGFAREASIDERADALDFLHLGPEQRDDEVVEPHRDDLPLRVAYPYPEIDNRIGRDMRPDATVIQAEDYSMAQLRGELIEAFRAAMSGGVVATNSGWVRN